MTYDRRVSSLCLSSSLCLLLYSVAAAAPLTLGDVIVNDPFFLPDRVFEYSPAGNLVQAIPVPYPVPGEIGGARGVVVDAGGLMHVWIGPFVPRLGSYESTSGTWTFHSYPGWSSVNCFPCNGIDAIAGYVFVTDMATFRGEDKGVIRFDTRDSTAQRFGSDQAYSDLTAGQDGLIYARRADLVDPPPPTVIDVYSPLTLVRLRTVTLAQRTLTIAVDAAGSIYGCRGGSVNQFDAVGNVVATFAVSENAALYDIDLSRRGRFVLSASDGEVIVTDSALRRIGSFHIISGSAAYVTMVDDSPVRLKAGLDLDPDVINPKSHAPWVTAYIEPSGFNPSSIDLSTLRLAGSVPAVSKFAIEGDHDANGVPDLAVKFSRDALDPLLHLGVNRLEVTGSLTTGEEFRGVDSIRVIDPGHGRPAFSVAPNPFNPSALLRFETTRPGPVRVQVFDSSGRLLRTLFEVPLAPGGEHEVKIEGRDDRGRGLPSGIYFYRIESPDGVTTGRFAIMK